VVLVMICLTSAGDGRRPWWVFAYASMTSAAVPAVSGADSLVPPLTPSPLAAGLSTAVQFRSPGATRSTVRALCVMPPELSELMLSLVQPVAPNAA
jgi:hypothetical protein